MAISFVAASPVGGSSTTSIVISSPTGTTTKDIMVACLGFRGNTVAITPPAGWTLIERRDEATHQSLVSYWREWQTGDTSFTWTLGLSTNHASAIVTYRGCFTSAPIDVFASQANSAASLNVDGPSLTTTFANDMLLAIALSESSGQVFVSPSGYTERAEIDAHGGAVNNSGNSIEISEKAFVGPGSTGAWVATQNNSRDSIGMSIALRDGASSSLRLLASCGVGR